MNTKATEIENKIPNTSSFISTPEFNRSRKISFKARTKKARKSFGSKTGVKNVLDLGDKIRRKIEKIETFDSSYLLVKFCLKNVVILYKI